jgi:hypothetical protein
MKSAPFLALLILAAGLVCSVAAAAGFAPLG